MNEETDFVSPRRRRRHRHRRGGETGGEGTTTPASNATLLFLLVVVGGGTTLAAHVLLSSSSSMTGGEGGGGTRATTTSTTTTALASRLSSAMAMAFGGILRGEGEIPAANPPLPVATTTTTAFFPGDLSADLAWEKSEDAFLSLGRHNADDGGAEVEEKEEEAGGAYGAGGRGGDDGRRRSPLDNLVRMFRPPRDDDPAVVARGLPLTPSSSSSSSSSSSRNRRRNTRAAIGESSSTVPPSGWMSSLSSPLPALPPLGDLSPSSLAFFCVSTIVLLSSLAAASMSFVARSRGGGGGSARRRRGVAIAAIDEDEAEIVEFYEREEMMERGTPPAKKGRRDDEDEDEDEWRRLRGDDQSGPSSAESPCENSHRRSASDSSLLGHPRHHPPGEKIRRHSKCDLYYSRVLGQLLNYEDEDVGDGVRPLTDQGEDEGDGDAPCHDDRDCQISALENFSSLTSEEDSDGASELEQDRADPTATADDTPPDSAGYSLVERTPTAGEGQGQVQEPGQKHAYYRSPSPLSSSSSISSLTSEGCDIEAPSANLLSASITPVIPGGEEQVSRRPSPTATAADAEYDVVSPTNNTPTRSNLNHDQSRCTLRGEKDLSSRRRVSFSPEVEVCDITPGHAATTGRKRVHELSFEVYLYIMLLAVAVAIAVLSLVPAHPSLSPVHSRGDIFRLTENLLNSQWDVEL